MESNLTTKQKLNPLANFMRQPKIYIRLPSQGLYWAKGSLIMPETEELAVYSMTAKDELAFKTPDALMNGQAVVDVIQSCVPAIKNAWNMPNIDMDAVLIAIRLATYGETLELTHTVPVVNEELVYNVDLRILLDQLTNSKWEEAVEIGQDLTCFVKPLTYKHMTAASMKTFETQKLMFAINDDSLSEERKLEVFNQSFGKLTELTIDLITDSVSSIKTPSALVKEPAYIKEFFLNADKEIFKKIQEHLDKLKLVTGLQPFKFTSTPEQVAAGAPETYEVPLKMDNSDFFVQGS